MIADGIIYSRARDEMFAATDEVRALLLGV